MIGLLVILTIGLIISHFYTKALEIKLEECKNRYLDKDQQCVKIVKDLLDMETKFNILQDKLGRIKELL